MGCGVSERDHENSLMRRPWPTGGCCTRVKKKRKNQRGIIMKVRLHVKCPLFLWDLDATLIFSADFRQNHK
jgi:hypothetical protein